MQMYACLGSSEIKSYGFEETRDRSAGSTRPPVGVLALEFVRGGTWYYFDVPARVFEDFLASESRGRFFQQHIRGVYREQRALAAQGG